ncbi:MAG: hypothetical protein ACI9SC_002056 [Gammaproteobacteria bacterium]|jgi:hypothetical protein
MEAPFTELRMQIQLNNSKGPSFPHAFGGNLPPSFPHAFGGEVVHGSTVYGAKDANPVKQ